MAEGKYTQEIRAEHEPTTKSDEVFLHVTEIHLEEYSHRIVARSPMHHIFGDIEMAWEGSGRPKFDIGIGSTVAVSWRVVDG